MHYIFILVSSIGLHMSTNMIDTRITMKIHPDIHKRFKQVHAKFIGSIGKVVNYSDFIQELLNTWEENN